MSASKKTIIVFNYFVIEIQFRRSTAWIIYLLSSVIARLFQLPILHFAGRGF